MRKCRRILPLRKFDHSLIRGVFLKDSPGGTFGIMLGPDACTTTKTKSENKKTKDVKTRIRSHHSQLRMSNLFGSRDLALFLPDKAGDVISLRHTELNDESIQLQPLIQKVDKTKKTVRYFAGKAPVWISEDTKSQSTLPVSNKATSVVDNRLARLAQFQSSNESNSNVATRRIHEAKVVSYEEGQPNQIENNDNYSFDDAIQNDFDDNENSENSDGEEDDINRRRARMLEKLSEAPSKFQRIDKYVPEPESSDSDSCSDSSEDGDVIKPVFVPKSKRTTVLDREKEIEIQQAQELHKKQEKDDRVRLTRAIVAESIARNEEVPAPGMPDIGEGGRIDDTDDPADEDAQFELWKVREMNRLKRDSEQRELAAIEKKDLERRREMTEEERIEEDKALGKFSKEKKQMKFMQKYYHKGAFYVDEDSLEKAEVLKRDYFEPTLEDKYNREALPEVMQVKKFGMRGRTKYTHLANEDTTRLEKPLIPKDAIKDVLYTKGGGFGNIDDAGRLKRSKH